MRTPKILRTQAFRIVAIYLAIFAVSAIALVGFVYWNTARVLDRETDEIIEAEISGLLEQYPRLDLYGLTNAIIGRSIRREQGLYLLANSNHRVIAGSLDGWPQVVSVGGGFVEFPYERRVGTATELRSGRGKIITLPQGFYLLVARDVEDRRVLEGLFQTALYWGAGMMIVLGLAGGLLISRNFLARLDVINRTSRQIMGGDLSLRVPVTPAGDEFDELSDNLNRMLDRIERLLHGMREVSDNVAHDLRSPLNRLRNRLELAAMRQSPDSETARDFDAAVQETDRLIGTFNALLLIAEAEAGSVRETMRDLSLTAVIEGVGELYGPLAEEKQLRFVVKQVPDSGLVRGNLNLISQALANLVDNAIKYTPSGGTVLVALENHENGPALVVADNGPGIPAEDRIRVTQRFVRLESSRNSPGTGLGLSLVAAVAHMHEAELTFEDNQPGLRATLSFKRVADEVRAPKTAPARQESHSEPVH
ncbi:MAG TPA: HAMP domain-containing sensor histidine kinase [Micropepsaceae bacterium]|nr:HAMP domain-containing sensor histidine kinase [Micropepsaceae bacterium]